ncbi:MAG: tetratricopeptide repeat protein [Candidatus Neomarinimicrobiota bacterium]
MATTQVCVPSSSPDPAAEQLSEAEKKKRERDCLIALSNGWEYFKNREYESSVRNYKRLVDLGCGEEYASEFYLYYGRAYIEMAKLDSAVFVFQQGLRYLPEDKNLLENMAYVMGKQGKLDRQINYYYRIVEVDPRDTEVMSSLVDVLKTRESWEDLIAILNQWLAVEPENARVQSELIQAFTLSGKDPLQFMRDRWKANTDNAQWGIDYARKLIENMDYAMAYRELESVIELHPTIRLAYQVLAEAALDEGDMDRAIAALQDLYALNRTDSKAAMDLSQAYLRKGNYESALEWAETGIRTSNMSGEAYYLRGNVFYSAAEECSAARENGVSNFQDKLVFLMSHEDYSTAMAKGYRRARTRADFLEKNLIPTKGDWFLQQADIRVFKPQGNYYSWITRTVNRP